MTTASPEVDERLRPALEALARADEDFATAYAACGLPAPRRSETGFAGLIKMIAGQQVSAHAARAIVARLEDAVRPLAPEPFLALDEAGLRAIGFSRQKILYGRGLAEALASGALDLDAIGEMEDDDAIARLTSLKGIGRWTAEIYLLFALQRPDVFPADDLAVATAAQHLKRLEARPSGRNLRALAEAWRPHRSAAARFLWHYYRHPGIALGR